MLTIDSQAVHIWILDLARVTAQPALLERYHPLLSEEEATRLGRFAFPKLQQYYLATRALVRTCLSRYADVAPHAWRFAQQQNGKPYLVDSPVPLSFNLSHAGDRAVLAVTRDNAVGIDIEQLSRKRDWLGIAEHYFHSSEVDALNALPEAQQHDYFFRLWTLKEAYLKARGTGISTGLDKAAFQLDRGRVRAQFAPELAVEPSEWHFFNYQLGDEYSLSLACHSPASSTPPQLQFYQSWPLATDQQSALPTDILSNRLSEPAAGGQPA